MWMLVFGHHEDRTPTHGYEPTREGARIWQKWLSRRDRGSRLHWRRPRSPRVGGGNEPKRCPLWGSADMGRRIVPMISDAIDPGHRRDRNSRSAAGSCQGIFLDFS